MNDLNFQQPDTPPVAMKSCRRCGIRKPIATDFGRRKQGRSGVREVCKACYAERGRHYRRLRRGRHIRDWAERCRFNQSAVEFVYLTLDLKRRCGGVEEFGAELREYLRELDRRRDVAGAYRVGFAIERAMTIGDKLLPYLEQQLQVNPAAAQPNPVRVQPEAPSVVEPALPTGNAQPATKAAAVTIDHQAQPTVSNRPSPDVAESPPTPASPRPASGGASLPPADQVPMSRQVQTAQAPAAAVSTSPSVAQIAIAEQTQCSPSSLELHDFPDAFRKRRALA